MSFPPRFVTIISLLQFFFITGGFLFTRLNVNLTEKMFEEMGPPMPQTSAIAGFVDTFGPGFLLIPAMYFTFFVLRARAREGVVGLTSTESAVGIVLTLAVALFFSLSALIAMLTNWEPVITDASSPVFDAFKRSLDMAWCPGQWLGA